MTTDDFIRDFGVLADAPNGVQKLREMILQLAVQGKLVEQNAGDEPAKVLLEMIADKKKQLIRAGKIKNRKTLTAVDIDTAPYQLPTNWQWTRLGNTGAIFNGNSIPKSKKELSYTGLKEGFSYIATKDIGYGRTLPDCDNGVRIPYAEHSFKIAHADAVLICSEGGSAGKKLAITDIDICFGNKLYANEVFPPLLARFIFYVYQSAMFQVQFRTLMTGIIGGISLNKFQSIAVPLPPLAEQKRIVAKVDELMQLCDELEERQARKNESRVTLNASCLNALLDIKDGSPANGNAQSSSKRYALASKRVFDNFNILYDNPENVAELRKAILQLAVQGRLVPQDPKDEPAEVLIDKITRERERLIKMGDIRKSKSLSPVNLEETPYALPDGWDWAKLGRMVSIQTGKKDVNQGHEDGLYPFFSCALEPLKSNEYSFDCEALLLPGNGANVGLVTHYAGKFEAYQRTYVLNDFIWISPQYIENVLRARFLKSLEGRQYGSAINYIKLGNLTNFLVPLPPLAEQKRIVAKVDELMRLCDELELTLKQSQTDSEKLISSAVNHLTEAV